MLSLLLLHPFLCAAAAVVLGLVAYVWYIYPYVSSETLTRLNVSNPKHEQFVTFFHPGLGAAGSQACRYAGLRGLTLREDLGTMGAFHAVADQPSLLAYNISVIEPWDVEYDPSRVPWPLRIGKPILYVLLSTWRKVAPAWPASYCMQLSRLNVAQSPDIDNCAAALRERLLRSDRFRSRPVVLYGCSRGASTVFSVCCVLATRFPEDWAQMRKQIKLVVVEAGFDNVPHVLRRRYGAFLGGALERFLPLVTSYNREAAVKESPLAYAQANMFPRDLPVAFITSKVDRVVPLECTMALRDALVAARGDKLTHTLTLDVSTHSGYANERDRDALRYKQFLEQLYDLYAPPL